MAAQSTGMIQSGAKPDGLLADILMGGGGRVSSEINTEDDRETVKLVLGMLKKARDWKAIWAKDHDRWWNYWESNHYKGRVVRTITQAIVNQVWSSIETMLGHIVDALPEPIARARTPQWKPNAKLATKWLKYEAEANDLEQEIQHPIRSACVTGAGWMKIVWNPEKSSWRGDVEVVPIDEKFIFPSPYARNLKEALYVVEAKNVPREFVVKTWERGEAVPTGAMDGSLWNVRQYSEPETEQSAPNVALVTTTTGSDSRWTGSANLAGGKKSDLVTLIEAWIKQDDGSMRLVVIANGVLLQDGPSPYDDDDFPYAVFNVVPTLDTIQGRGLVQFVEGLQDLLNSSLSNIIDQQRFAADPMMGVANVNLDEAQHFENVPGSVLPDAHLSASGSPGYYWLSGPGFNQAWITVQNVVTEYMDSVLGRVDVLRGERPAGVTTLGGLEIIREQANVRIRNLIRWVKASLKRVHLLVLSRLRQFATAERTFRILGPLGQEEFVTVNAPSGVGPDGSLRVERSIPQDAEFDIQFGKEVPGGRQAAIELAMQLAATPAEDGLPMVDRQYVLEKTLEDEAPEVLARMGEMAAQQAQAAAQQQQGAAAAAEGQPAQEPPVSPEDALDRVMEMFSGEAA